MTEDTKRALEVIKPIADELHIDISADKDKLYANGTEIGIACNSTYATVMEFIGYVFLTQYNNRFRDTYINTMQTNIINRYWIKG